jgi:hypothetical protein
MSNDARDIRAFLEAEAQRAPQPTGITPTTVRRARLKRAGLVTSSLLLAAITVGGIALTVSTIRSDAPPVPPSQHEDAAPPDVNPRVTATIPVGQFPRSVEIGYGYAWVAVNDPDQSPGFTLTRIDPSTNEVVDSLPLEHTAEMAVGAGAVWVVGYEDATRARLLRIDPQTNSVVETVRLDCGSNLESPDCHPISVTAEEIAVWVTLSSNPGVSGEVVRIDPTTNKIVARIPVEEDGPRDIVVAGGSVWVNVQSDVEDDLEQGASLHRIDPQTNDVVDVLLRNKLLLGGDDPPPVMAASSSDVWVVREDSQGETTPVDVVAVRIDARTGDILRESGNLVPDGMGPTVFPFASDGESMWFYGGGKSPFTG